MAPGPAAPRSSGQSSAGVPAPRGSLLGRCLCPQPAPARASSYCDAPGPAPLSGTPRAGPSTPYGTGSPEVPQDPSCHPALHMRTLSQPGPAPSPGPGSLPSSPFPTSPGASQAGFLTGRLMPAGHKQEPSPCSQCCPGRRGGSALAPGCCRQCKGRAQETAPARNGKRCKAAKASVGHGERVLAWGLGSAWGPCAGGWCRERDCPGLCCNRLGAKPQPGSGANCRGGSELPRHLPASRSYMS